MSHERETLEAVIKARNQASAGLQAAAADPGNAAAIQGLAGAEGMLTGAMGRLFAVAEQYPDLKANQNMAQLSEELTTTENKIAFARQNYNDQVNSYQAYKASFPQVILANSFGFKSSGYMDLEEKAHKRENIEVSFNDEPSSSQDGASD